MFQNKDKISRCSVASIGSSPSRKCRGTIGEYLLSLRNARITLLWKVVRVLSTGGLIGSAARPDLSTGLTKTDHVWCCTWGEILHL